MQTDPIEVEGGVNLFAYVTNDPINFVDPLGLAGLPNNDGGNGKCPKQMDYGACAYRNPVFTGNRASVGNSGGGLGAGGGGGGRNTPTERVAPGEPTSNTDTCRGMKAMEETGNAMMASGAVIALGGLITPGIPDGEAIGAITAGLGGASWLVSKAGQGIIKMTGGQCK